MKQMKLVLGSKMQYSQQPDHHQMDIDDTIKASLKNDRQERLLDRTKDYGVPAREKGRYGSHPSHDGFDDESKP